MEKKQLKSNFRAGKCNSTALNKAAQGPKGEAQRVVVVIQHPIISSRRWLDSDNPCLHSGPRLHFCRPTRPVYGRESSLVALDWEIEVDLTRWRPYPVLIYSILSIRFHPPHLDHVRPATFPFVEKPTVHLGGKNLAFRFFGEVFTSVKTCEIANLDRAGRNN